MKPLRILLVDDEPSVLWTLAATLELEGLEIATAGSGEGALVLLGERPFDLVLSDVRMPGMNGVELFRQIRKLRPELPVILMTAFAVESLVEQALREGAFTVLPKPFDVRQVLETLLHAARRPTALIVDGHDAGPVAEALVAIGLNAQAADDEQTAISAISAQAVDVCVIELGMASSGEPPLISRLRLLDPRLSFIALAGHDIPELMRRIAASGVVTWVRKPVNPAVLAQRIAGARGQRVVRK